MIPVSLITGWINSITYVAACRFGRFVSGHWSAWQAARVEVNQSEEQQAKDEEDLAGEIVDRVVQDTEISADPG